MCGRDRNSPKVLRAWARGRGSAQHAAVATLACFLAEVKNAATSLLITAEGDGVGHRDGECRRRRRGWDSYLIHHPLQGLSPPPLIYKWASALRPSLPTIASASGKVGVHVSARLRCLAKAGDSGRRWISAAFLLYLLQTHAAIFPKGHRVNKTW